MHDAGEAEDATQEAFIKAYRALPKFRGDSAFYTWLYRIAINTVKNCQKAGARRPPTLSDVDAVGKECGEDDERLKDLNTPESAFMDRQIVAAVNAGLEDTPEHLRTAITLREIEGLSYEDIAHIMDCPVGTVRSRIFRAREFMAQRLRPLLDTPRNRRW